jgi:hypothetical protein
MLYFSLLQSDPFVSLFFRLFIHYYCDTYLYKPCMLIISVTSLLLMHHIIIEKNCINTTSYEVNKNIARK